MNLNHLAIFHAVAEEGSISRGAERLHTSQPSVSKQLAEFERALSAPLFDRIPRGTRLTEAGTLLHSYSRRLFAIEQEAERALRELRGLERGRLAIGASTSIGAYLLPAVMAEFHRAHPHVEIYLEINNTESIQQALEGGTLDLGFTEGFVHSDNLEALIFHEDELVAIAAPGHRLSQVSRELRPVTVEEICAEPFLLRETGSGTREVIEKALKSRGLFVLPVMTLGNTEAIKRAVAEDMGVAFVSRLTVQSEVEEGRLVVLRPIDFTLRRPLHQVQFRGHHAPASVQAFLKILRKAMEGWHQ